MVPLCDKTWGQEMEEISTAKHMLSLPVIVFYTFKVSLRCIGLVTLRAHDVASCNKLKSPGEHYCSVTS
jgi:hypothetical protein